MNERLKKVSFGFKNTCMVLNRYGEKIRKLALEREQERIIETHLRPKFNEESHEVITTTKIKSLKTKHERMHVCILVKPQD